ncbi:hypothetical protein H0H87_006117 [Tephrocybe sp. NHM501043]|nr:hypothetical protein H0H87_006117 [Tephrocybe sp. NHM501043]
MLLDTAEALYRDPESVPLFNLRLLPLTIERGALLAQAECEERHGIKRAQHAYDEECEHIEEEWRKGRERVRERLLEGIEERKRRAREEKEGEGPSDATADSSSRAHVTRKLRNKPGTSPPPTPHELSATPQNGFISSLPITSGPFLDPHSLSVDDLPSPFPLRLTASVPPTATQGASGATSVGGRRKPRNTAGPQQQAGKILAPLAPYKDAEVEGDMTEIRRATKRRRTTAMGLGKLGVV